MLPPIFMALGVAGLASLWRGCLLGSLALWLSIIGANTLAQGILVSEWFRSNAGWGMLFLGSLAHTIGLFLFGLVNLKGRVLHRWNALPLVVGLFGGLVPFALSFFIPEQSDLPWWMLLAVLGVGWLLLGGLMLRSQSHEERIGLER